jgi:hypothetical protein
MLVFFPIAVPPFLLLLAMISFSFYLMNSAYEKIEANLNDTRQGREEVIETRENVVKIEKAKELLMKFVRRGKEHMRAAKEAKDGTKNEAQDANTAANGAPLHLQQIVEDAANVAGIASPGTGLEARGTKVLV